MALEPAPKGLIAVLGPQAARGPNHRLIQRLLFSIRKFGWGEPRSAEPDRLGFRTAFNAIFAFSAASIFRVVLLVIIYWRQTRVEFSTL